MTDDLVTGTSGERVGPLEPLPGPLAQTLDLILDVLRANNLHQDHCQALGVARANAHGGMYFLPKPCDCWLSDQRK